MTNNTNTATHIMPYPVVGTVLYRDHHAGPQSSYEEKFESMQEIQDFLESLDIGCQCCDPIFRTWNEGKTITVYPGFWHPVAKP